MPTLDDMFERVWLSQTRTRGTTQPWTSWCTQAQLCCGVRGPICVCGSLVYFICRAIGLNATVVLRRGGSLSRASYLRCAQRVGWGGRGIVVGPPILARLAGTVTRWQRPSRGCDTWSGARVFLWISCKGSCARHSCARRASAGLRTSCMDRLSEG